MSAKCCGRREHWSGQAAASPRTTVPIGSCLAHVTPPSAAWPADGFDEWCTSPTDTTLVAGVIVDEGEAGLWKLLVEPRIPMNGWQVSRHDIAAIWVAFFSRCQRYLVTGPVLPERNLDGIRDDVRVRMQRGLPLPHRREPSIRCLLATHTVLKRAMWVVL